MRKSFLCSLCVLLALALAAPAVAEPAALTCGVRDIQVFGNLVLDLAPAALAEAGYEYGDVLSLTVDGTEYQVPFCTNYSDVDVNETVLRDSEGVLTLAINMGDFATQNGIAAKVATGEDAFAWQVSGGREIGDLQVSIVLAVKGGYRDEYLSRQLFSTNAREDYASDAVFANFRAVAGGALGENALFRSSSPLNNDLGRAAYANALLAESGRATVMNLSDSREQIEAFAAPGRLRLRGIHGALRRPGKSSPCKWAWISPPMISRPGWAAGCNSCPPRKAPISCIAAKARIARALFARF